MKLNPTFTFFLFVFLFLLASFVTLFLGGYPIVSEGFDVSGSADKAPAKTVNNPLSDYVIPNGSSIYDNYNHFSGSSYPTQFFSIDGSTAKITQDSSGTESIKVTDTTGLSNIYNVYNTDSNGYKIYKDNKGGTAIIILNSNNSLSVQVTVDGQTKIFRENASTPSPNNNNNNNTNNGSASASSSSQPNSLYYGPFGSTAKIVNTSGKNTIVVTYSDKTTSTFNLHGSTKYKDSTGNVAIFVNINGKPSIQVTNIDNTQTVFTFGQDSVSPNISNSSASSSESSSSTPSSSSNKASDNGMSSTPSSVSSSYQSPYFSPTFGTSSSQIPKGEEDKYILKTEIIPPVCPVCAPVVKCDNKNTDGSGKKCPPCPACARCPEPPVRCVAEPNYSSPEISKYLPQPVIANFSTFGM